MTRFTKILPFIVLAIALASLYFQYKTYDAASADCGCQEKISDDGTGPVV